MTFLAWSIAVMRQTAAATLFHAPAFCPTKLAGSPHIMSSIEKWIVWQFRLQPLPAHPHLYFTAEQFSWNSPQHCGDAAWSVNSWTRRDWNSRRKSWKGIVMSVRHFGNTVKCSQSQVSGLSNEVDKGVRVDSPIRQSSKVKRKTSCRLSYDINYAWTTTLHTNASKCLQPFKILLYCYNWNSKL